MKLRTLLASAALLAGCGGAKPETTIPAPPAGGTEVAPKVAAAQPATQTQPAPTARARKVRTVEGITEYQLDNGLRVLSFPDPSQSTVTINVTYLVGSRLEGYGETGMAHLLEHMMFKGSPRHRNVLKLLQEKGGQANGSTWYDRTNYFETLPASQENLDWALDLESDRMINAEVSPDDLKTEFSVVRNEFEGGENNPDNILDERVSETAFLWHNYGKPTIGSRSDIERVPADKLRAFYTKYYQPDDAILILSGKYDEEAALASVEKTFGAIPKPTRVLQDAYTVEPQQDGERSVTLRRTGNVSVVELAYHDVAGSSPDFPAVEAAADILTREPSGRLYKKLVDTKLATNLGGGADMRHDPGLVEFSCDITDPKNVDKVTQIMEQEIEGLAASKIDQKELERWRASSLKNLELQLANSRQVAITLSEFAALGDWRTLFAYRDRIKTVTVADVQRVAQEYLKRSNRTLGTFVPTTKPDRAPLTETPDVENYVKDIQGGQEEQQGEVFAATLDNIEARTTRKELKGGIKAALLSKKTRGAKVQLSFALHWGNEKSLQNKAAIGRLMGELMVRGTAKKSYQDIQDLEDQLKARIWISSSADGMTLHIETLHDKLAAAMDLAAEMMESPSFPAKELDLVKQEQIADLEQQLQNPGAIAFATLEQMSSKWAKSDPRYPATPAERMAELKKVTDGQIRSFYKEFAGAGHAELVVVGDFDAAALSAQVEKLFGTWQTKKPYARLADKSWHMPGATKTVDLPDKAQTTLALGEDIAMKDTDADYPAWLMMSQVLGGDTGSRAWMRLREHEGLSYGVQTWAYASALDVAGGFGGFAIVAPQNAAKAKASFLDEIQKMVTGSVTDDELQKAKDAWLKDEDTNLSNDNYVVRMLSNELFDGRTTSYAKELRAKVAAVTAADVERVAKKDLDPNRLIVIDAGDQAKAKAAAASGGAPAAPGAK